MTQISARQFAPATQRNRDPILAVLQQVLPPKGLVLEIAGGTGEHAVYFTPRLAPRYWLPTDVSTEALDSIRSWIHHSPTETLLSPILLDVNQPEWHQLLQAPLSKLPSTDLSLTAIVNINMIHISPWSTTLGLMAGAEALLPVGGVLYLYGPYKQNGCHTAHSNELFDQSLRSRNPEWGVRDLESVVRVAAEHRLLWKKTIEMPANNLSVVFERQESAFSIGGDLPANIP
ncbi:MAG: class I SAM-dependent methyltransferase [Thermosynechococcaceae cyanobacterium MS004]|nr:class I SAM-dependent methyltransferase [Thermosynechococcaceae cyanobacterium MS004]